MYASVFDYLHGSETKAAGLELEAMILDLKNSYRRIQKDLNNDSPAFKHQETIKKFWANMKRIAKRKQI